MILEKFLFEIEQHRTPFRIKSSQLNNYIHFEEADQLINDLEILVYHNLQYGKDHVKERFEERVETTHRIASHTKTKLFKWPNDYIKYLHKGLNKIYKKYDLNNNAYILQVLKLNLQYLLILGQPYEESSFNLEHKYVLVNTLFDSENEVNTVKFLSQKYPAKKLIIENIQNIIKIRV